jgi:hypothetical protein
MMYPDRMRFWMACAAIAGSLVLSGLQWMPGAAMAEPVKSAPAKPSPEKSEPAKPSPAKPEPQKPAKPAPAAKTQPAKPLTLPERLKRAGFSSLLAESRAEHAQRQWDHLASSDGAQCREDLKKTGAVFRAVPDREKPDQNGCGVPHGVIVTKGPTGITYSGPLFVDCSLALQLPAIEKVIQEEAVKHLGSPIKRVTTLGSYSCRSIRGWNARISQHALGNAMDMAAFTPERGQAASVMRDYKPGVAEQPTVRGKFLRAIYGRLWSEGGVTRVLGPEWDASHRDHFHLDRGLRGFR